MRAFAPGLFYNLCYTFGMNLPHSHWSDWFETLHSKGLVNWVALLLEAAGPLNLIGAQLLYFGAPLFSKPDQIDALARLLEEDSETRAFVAYLRGRS